MRPAGRDTTDSLYFSYPYFAAPDPASRSHGAPVAIVGAGPVGLTAALALANEGIRCILFDKKSTFNDGSRALCLARASYTILERLGAIEPFLEKSLGWTTGRSYYRGHQILEFHMPDSDTEKYRPMYNLQQQYIEQYLWQAVDASDLIEQRWQSEVTALDNGSDHCTLQVVDPYGSYTCQVDWLLACDGAHSAIRKHLGLRLQGENFEGRYVIADIQMDHDYPTIRRALFDPDCRRGGTVLIHRQPDNLWRIDYQLGENESTDDALLEDNVRDSVTAVLKDIGYTGDWELEWWSVYTANTLALDDYRHQRVFFVGDSAHIVPIFGVRGLNNGLADAANIGWKLGWVLDGRAGQALLDSYTPERRGATLDVFANASKSARFMTPDTHGWKLMRDAALSLAVTQPFAGELANPRQMTPFTYQQSPAVLTDDKHFTGGPVAGAMLPECAVAEGYLSEQTGRGFTVLCFSDAMAQRISNEVSDTIKVLTLPEHLQTAFAATEHSAYLIRPDFYIAARWYRVEPGQVQKAVAHILCQAE